MEISEQRPGGRMALGGAPTRAERKAFVEMSNRIVAMNRAQFERDIAAGRYGRRPAPTARLGGRLGVLPSGRPTPAMARILQERYEQAVARQRRRHRLPLSTAQAVATAAKMRASIDGG